MTTDIVDRLKEHANASWLDRPVVFCDLKEAAAEIVRLRGEVCSCPSGDGSLRWPCKAHPPGAIAPAEAKGDALLHIARLRGISNHIKACPAYENLRGDADCIDSAIDFILTNTPQPADGGAVAWLPSAHEWLSENQGAASQDWMDGWNACRSRWQSITTQAPAVPTGAVWIMPVATDPPQNRNLMRMAWGASALSTGELANAYDSIVSAAQRCGQVITHPQAAQVQQEAVVDARILELADRLVAPGPKAAHVSASECHELRDFIHDLANPAGDALGAVEIDEAMIERGCKAIAPPVMLGEQTYRSVTIAVLEAALQHRGDSRGGEGS